MIAAAVALLVALALAVLVRRAGRRDAIDLVAALVPRSGRAWLQAMRAEHAAIEDPAERRRFARGCVRAALCARWAKDATAASLRAVVVVASVAVAGLAAFGLIAYPGVRSGWWLPELASFVAALTVCAALGLRLSLAGPAESRRIALLTGLPAAGLCAAAAAGSGAPSYALAIATLTLPALAAVLAATTGERDGAGVAAVLCAVIAGLFAFAGFLVVTYATDGGAATPQLLAEFRRSGATDYATWAVGDDLGGAVFLLASTLAVGAVAAAAIAGTSPAPRRV